MSNKSLTNSANFSVLIDEIKANYHNQTKTNCPNLILTLSGEEIFPKFNESNNIPSTSNFITLLRNCVIEAEQDLSVAQTLENCKKTVNDKPFPDGLREIFKQCQEQSIPSRLEQNIKALITSAQTAIAALSFNEVDTKKYAKELISLLPKAQISSNSVTKKEPLLGSNNWVSQLPQEQHQVVLKKIFDELFSELPGHYGQIVSAYYWVEYFLQKEEKLHLNNLYRRVPVTAYLSSLSRPKSFLAYLEFYLIDTKEATLIEHPSSCLLQLGEELLEGIKRAWECVKSSEQSVVWRFRTQAIEQNGDSLSAAASCAIYSLYQNTPFDDKKVVLGVIRSTPNPTQPYFTDSNGQQHINYQVDPVDYEVEKLKKAKEHGLTEAILSDILPGPSKAFKRHHLNLENLQKDDLKIQYISDLASMVKFTQKVPLVAAIPGLPVMPTSLPFEEKHFNSLKKLLKEKLLPKANQSIETIGNCQENISTCIKIYGKGTEKTTLALSLVYEEAPDLWRTFSGGYIWVSFGMESNMDAIATSQHSLIDELTKTVVDSPNNKIRDKLTILSIPQNASKVIHYKELLKTCFVDKQYLLILDNVSTQEQFDAFDVVNSSSKMIITTHVPNLGNKKTIEFALPNSNQKNSFTKIVGLPLILVFMLAIVIVASLNTKPETQEAALGVTIWQVPSPLINNGLSNEDGDRGLTTGGLENSAPVPQKPVPEQIKSPVILKNPVTLEDGSHIQLSLESLNGGYVYVLTREQYLDGTYGEPYLVYPIEGANHELEDNFIKPGKILFLPRQQQSLAFTIVNDSKALLSQIFTIIIAPSSKALKQLKPVICRYTAQINLSGTPVDCPPRLIEKEELDLEASLKEWPTTITISEQKSKDFSYNSMFSLETKSPRDKNNKFTYQDLSQEQIYTILRKPNQPYYITIPIYINNNNY